MLFLQIVGIPAVEVPGENISEAASVDAVLVLDNSESQSYSFDQLPNPWRDHCSQTKINDMYACLNGGTLEDGTVIPAGGCNDATVSDPNLSRADAWHLPAFPQDQRSRLCLYPAPVSELRSGRDH